MDEPRNRSKDQENEEDRDRYFRRATDQGVIDGLVKAHEILRAAMFAWMVVIVLRAEVFNTQYVVGRGNIGKQRRNNQPHADNVEPRGRALRLDALAK